MKSRTLAFLTLVAFSASIVLVQPVESGSVLTQSSEEARFTGVAVEYIQSPVPGGASGWRVAVDEVISGPMIEGEVLVGMQAYPPQGYQDPTIEAGDEVEAFGLLNPHGSDPTFVSLNGEDYYIAKTSGEVAFTGVAVQYIQDPAPGSASGWTVTVDEVISGPMIEGEVLVGMQAYPPQGYQDLTIEAGDEVEAFGLLNPHGTDPAFVSLNGEDYYILKVRKICLPLIVRDHGTDSP